MKNVIILSIAVASIFVSAFWETKNPLGKKGEHKIHEYLLGSWNVENGDISQISISKKDNFTYTINVINEREKDNAANTQMVGWITKIKSRTFLCIDSGNGYSHYLIEKVNNNKITALNIYTGDESKDLSTNDLRKYVESDLAEDMPRRYQTWLKK